MDYVKKYGELIKDKAGVKPERARSMIRLGLRRMPEPNCFRIKRCRKLSGC